MPIRKTTNFNDIDIKFMDNKPYFDYVKRKFKELLEHQQAQNVKDEPAVQQFIEKYPTAISGILGELPAGYNIAGMTLISQPRLKTYPRDRQPDFLIITGNSLQIYFNFIEIESPAKLFFHPVKHKASTEFLEAVSQIREWKAFATKHLDEYAEELIQKIFRDNADMTKRKTFNYTFTLIYGNAREVTDKNDPTYNDLLETFFEGDMKLVTYSRLLREMTLRCPLMTVTRRADINQFVALGMVPWKNYKVDEWQNYHLIQGKAEIVKNCTWLTGEESRDLLKKMREIDSLTAPEIWKRDDLTTTDLSDNLNNLDI